MSSDFPSWLHSSNPLLRETQTNKNISQQRRELSGTTISQQRRTTQQNTTFDRSNATFGVSSNNNGNFSPSNYRESHFDVNQNQQQHHQSPSPKLSNEERLKQYIHRPAIEQGIYSVVTSSSPAPTPAPQQRQQQQYTPSSAYYNCYSPSPTKTSPTTSIGIDLERFSSAERLIAQVMARHSYLDDDDEQVQRQEKFASFRQPLPFEIMSSSSPPSQQTPTTSSVLVAPAQLERAGFAPSTIKNIVSLTKTLEKGKETIQETTESIEQVKREFSTEVEQVQNQIRKLNQGMEEWRKQIEAMSPMRNPRSQFSFDPEEEEVKK
jgi:hypothetical protein